MYVQAINGLIIVVYKSREHFCYRIKLWYSNGYSIFSLVYPWLIFLFICIFQLSEKLNIVPDISLSHLCCFIGFLVVSFIKVEFTYFLRVNIVALLLIGFNVSFHFENYWNNSFMEFFKYVIEDSRILLCYYSCVVSKHCQSAVL